MERPKLFLISSCSGPGFRYVATQVFERWLGLEIGLCSENEPVAEGAISLGYGVERGNLRIPDSGFLEQNGVRPLAFDFSRLPDVQAVEKSGTFLWTYDVLSLIFWSLTRMEEYGKPDLADAHRRFPEEELTAVKHGFQDIPFVDQWVNQLARQLQSLGLPVKNPKFSKVATLDIDNPTAYRHKGFLRNAGSVASHFLQGNRTKSWQRLAVSLGLQPDPFYSFPRIEEVCQRLDMKPMHFFWIGDYGPNDKGLSHQNPFFRRLVQETAQRYPVGLHPSYRTLEEPHRIKTEKERLERITGQRITQSRQHYLRFRFPETFRHLIEAGITDDYSLGFSSVFGYRAGTSQSFVWFDVEKNQETRLTLHPFALMDSTALHYLRLSPEEFIETARDMESRLRHLGGTLSLLFHNENIGGQLEWKGWERVFETLMTEPKPR